GRNSYTDTAVSATVGYRYRVRATNDAGMATSQVTAPLTVLPPLAVDLGAVPAGEKPSYLTAFNGALLFAANHGLWKLDGAGNNATFASTLWKTDGTAAGTKRVAPRLVSRLFPSGGVGASNGLFYYPVPISGGGGSLLYATDGTDAGTYQVKGLPNSPSNGDD